MSIAKDIDKICKGKKSSIESLIVKQKLIREYYYKNNITDVCLLKRLKEIIYAINFGRSCKISIILGLVTGVIASVIYQFIPAFKIKMPDEPTFLFIIGIILGLLIFIILYLISLFPFYGCLGLAFITAQSLFKNDYHLFLIKYERNIIIDILKIKNIDLSYIK